MCATPMKGKPLAERIRAEVAEEVKAVGRIGLVTVLVGDDPASDVYIRLKHKAATEAGFDATDLRLPADTAEEALLAKVAELNAGRRRRDPRPAAAARPHRRGADHPRGCSRQGRRRLPPAECRASSTSAGRRIVSATPRGVMALLAEHRVELDGARVVVIGRSAIVGKPVPMLLQQANATVTLCHSHTRDLAAAHPRRRRARRRRRRAGARHARHGEGRLAWSWTSA